MQFKQKLAYMALGGLLVFMGQLLPNLTGGTATAQKSKETVEFDTIKVRRIEIADNASEAKITIGVEQGKPIIELKNKTTMSLPNIRTMDGRQIDFSTVGESHATLSSGALTMTSIIDLTTDEKTDRTLYSARISDLTGISLHCIGNNGQGSVILQPGKDEGYIMTIEGDNKNGIEMSYGRAGGYVVVKQKGNNLVQIGVPKGSSNGLVSVRDIESKGAVNITVDEHGGVVLVTGQGDETKAAQMAVDEYGGVVLVTGKGSTKSRAVMSVNEYGNGAIGLWDKRSYRIK